MNAHNRILAVEDSPTQGELLVGYLREAGFEVTLATSGEAAVDCLRAQTFDLVLSDVVMPGMDGYQLCEHVKAHSRDVPVVLLTSLTDPLEIVRGLEAGADNFLRKPYEPEQLISRLRNILSHRAMRAGGRANLGLEVVLRDKRFLITAERQQILDLLLSSFEDLVTSNRHLAERDEALEAAATQLGTQLAATERERRRLATLLDAVPNPMVMVDPDGTITDASDQLCVLLGHPREQIVGQQVRDLVTFVDATGKPIAREARALALALGEGRAVELGTNFDLFIESSDGQRSAVIARAAPVRDEAGTIVAAVGSLHEIGELAAHDPVTALPNHTLFVDRVARALDASASDVAIIAVVLDRFTHLQHQLGDRATDRLLAAVAATIRELLGEEAAQRTASQGQGSAAYLGGGLFALAWPDLDDELDAVRLAHRAHAKLTAAPLGGGDTAVSFTLGLTLASSPGTPIDDTAAAIAAAHRGSAAGGSRIQIADPDVDARAASVLHRAGELRRALTEHELVVHYQPEIDLHTGAPVGAEALVRWQHPTEGLLLPGDFLPAAEAADLLCDLGWYVLDEACRQAARWHAELAGGEGFTVAVNVEASQLVDPHVVERVSSSLRAAGLDPAALTLEITEGEVVDNAGVAAGHLRDLKALGVRIAIDDFGTGYSSLRQLRRFPIDTLKIDREFVDGMTAHSDDAAIVAATVRLGRALGLETVAEGVETEEQLVQLRVLGCDTAQGFHWTPALPAAAFEEWWQQHQSLEVPTDATTVDTLDDASAGVDEIVAYLVHELRAPLTVVMGYADLALRNGGAEPKYLEPILRNVEDLDRRLTMLADLRRAGHGAVRLELEATDVAEVVLTVANDLRTQLHPHHVVVQADTPVIGRIDRFRLGQAVTNLLQNAAKFSPADTLIDVSVRAVGQLVEVSVRDHGPGIAAHRRPELFRRFSRLGSQHTGMGVGLYLVRAIARAHGGDVHYEDATDGGALFTILVPGVVQGVCRTPTASSRIA